MPPGSVHLHAADVLGQALDHPLELLDLSLDQLRTLVVVHETGTALHAARQLGREQSSVQKQLDNLNRAFQRLCGEPLVIKQGRGQNFLVTPTGEEVVELVKATLESWQHGIHAARRRLGSTVTIGTTEFTLEFVGRIWPNLRDEFERREIDLKIVHIRTRDFWSKLEAQQVDLICGSLATEVGQQPTLNYDFIEWHREGVALLTNLTTHELPDKPLTYERLATVPLLTPSAGLLADFLLRWFGPEYRNTLNVTADIDALNYGLALLDSQLLRGCLMTTESVAHAAVAGRLQGGHNLRMLPLATGFPTDLEIVTGIFARTGEREHYAPDHPLNLLWHEFTQAAPNG